MRLADPIHLAVAALMSLSLLADPTHAAEPGDTSRGDQMLAPYFRSETQKLADASTARMKSWDNWTSHSDEYRQQLREMLGLDPLPERTPLNPVVTGTLERDDFKVEKLYFQSRPHLYVTGNLYLPKKQTGRVPAILYVCGHSPVKKNGVSLGNKTHYQYQGAWFAQNGYACLVIDTLQMGEIEGTHHGTHHENMWWWNSRGYTPAGVEAWNSIRAIDYLVSRPEVDPDRIGITGRSGGGAYSWFAAALDDRIKVAVPVAGITNLKNHIVDGCVARHCDCMFFVNTYRWDYQQLAALAAPRPLLIANSDRDDIFPFDGVVDVYQSVRRLYESAGKGSDLALQMVSGPHHDNQVLQLHALNWFNKYLKGTDPLIETAAKDYFKPEELKVFDKLPTDQINTRIHESFVPQAAAAILPPSKAEWKSQRGQWLTALRDRCFHGWPESSYENTPPSVQRAFEFTWGSAKFSAYDFESQPRVLLRLYVLLPRGIRPAKLQGIDLRVLDASDWLDFLSAMRTKFPQPLAGESVAEPDERNYSVLLEALADGRGVAFIASRGIGPTQWSKDAKIHTHIRRRFMLLGQTLDGMRVWDIRRAIQALRSIEGMRQPPLHIMADQEMSGIALYAALFEPDIESVELSGLPKSHREGPDFLNVLRFLDMPQVVAMAAENSHVVIRQDGDAGWEYPLAVAKKLGWNDKIEIQPVSTKSQTARDASAR